MMCLIGLLSKRCLVPPTHTGGALFQLIPLSASTVVSSYSVGTFVGTPAIAKQTLVFFWSQITQSPNDWDIHHRYTELHFARHADHWQQLPSAFTFVWNLTRIIRYIENIHYDMKLNNLHLIDQQFSFGCYGQEITNENICFSIILTW